MRTILLTLLALIAFAGNSILCRLALDSGAIDAGSFTVLRLFSGIIALTFLLLATARPAAFSGNSKGSWLGGCSLFAYAAFFSFAYIDLNTAVGALILFGTVQISLILYAIAKGQPTTKLEYVGFVVACFGFVYLLWPSLSRPSAVGFVYMVIAGIAWAIYTVQGKGSKEPLADTAYNFLRTLPMVVILAIFMLSQYSNSVHVTLYGALLALTSGALTSGVGYWLWYAALPKLSTTTAAVSQLSVPIIAAAFGVMLANEALSWNLLVSGFLVLGGILIVVLAKRT